MEGLNCVSGIRKLISDGAIIACYPLHDGTIHTEGSKRKLLNDEWASMKKFWKYQPLDAIRDYYGVKMGLYFAWLGEWNYSEYLHCKYCMDNCTDHSIDRYF